MYNKDLFANETVDKFPVLLKNVIREVPVNPL